MFGAKQSRYTIRHSIIFEFNTTRQKIQFEGCTHLSRVIISMQRKLKKYIHSLF